MRRIFRSTIISLVLALLAGGAVAADSKGAQRTDWSFDWPAEGFYFACLNETLTGTIFVTTLSHAVETPSGTVHLLESFHGTGYVYSLNSDKTWRVQFAIPGVSSSKLGKGQSAMWQDIEHYMPDEGGGLHFVIAQSYKLTVNGNGELIVEQVKPPADTVWPDDYARCIGKPAE